MATSASVWLMTIYPPLFSQTLDFSDLVDLLLDAELLEQRRRLGVELDAPHQVRLEARGEAHDALVFLLVIHPDLREVLRNLVAQNALHQIQIVIDQRRRLAVVGAAADLGPQMLQEANVGAQFIFLDVRRPRCGR